MSQPIRIITIDKNNREDPSSSEYLNQYYAVRAKAFAQRTGTSRYTNAPSEYDTNENTVFALAASGDTIVGGCQMLVSTPEKRVRLKFESPYDSLKIENLLPHLDTSQLTYAELAGVCVDPSADAWGVGLRLQKHIAHMIKDHQFTADIVVGRVTPQNVSIILKAARDEQMPVIVRDDIDVVINQFPRIMMMYTPHENLPLISDEMKAKGVGVPGDEFLLREIHKKLERSKP